MWLLSGCTSPPLKLKELTAAGDVDQLITLDPESLSVSCFEGQEVVSSVPVLSSENDSLYKDQMLSMACDTARNNKVTEEDQFLSASDLPAEGATEPTGPVLVPLFSSVNQQTKALFQNLCVKECFYFSDMLKCLKNEIMEREVPARRRRG